MVGGGGRSGSGGSRGQGCVVHTNKGEEDCTEEGGENNEKEIRSGRESRPVGTYAQEHTSGGGGVQKLDFPKSSLRLKKF